MIGQDSSEIFESCVQAILERRATVEQCAARYPEVDGLHEALQAVQTVRLLPQGALSPAASRRILDQRLAPHMRQRITDRKMSVRPRRFSWGIAATAAAIFALVLVVAFIANNRTPTPQVAALPTRTASPILPPSQRTATAPSAQGASSDDFSVTIELSGTIETVALADRAHALAVTLDDGTSIRFDAPLTTDNELTPGLAITVLAEIDNGNQFVARSVTINGNATLNPSALTPESTASATEQCDKSPQPVAARLATSFNVDPGEIMGWFCKGYGFGEIAKAYLLAQKNSKLTVAQVFAMREAGQGWGLIAKNAGVSPKDMAKPLK